MNSKLFTYLLFFLMLTSCQHNEKAVLTKAKKIKTISEYNDGEFVINIVDITSSGNQVYLVEEGLSKIVKTQPELNSFELFGERGLGPNEIMSPALINVISESRILIYDKQKLKLFEYNKNNGLVEAEMPFNRMLLNQSFLAQDSIVFFTSPIQSKYDIERFDIKNKIHLNGFDLPESALESRMGRSIFEFQKGYVLLGGFNPPFIETYSADWGLLNSLQLSENELIQKLLREKPTLDLNSNLKVTEGKVKVQATARLVIRNARLIKDNLYLLSYHKNADEVNRSNMVFKYSYENNQWVLSNTIALPEASSYKTFYVTEDEQKIIAFEEINGQLELFELDL